MNLFRKFFPTPNPECRPIYVFGSSSTGEHGLHASHNNVYETYALNHRGAVLGVSEGLQGESYAIPTYHLRVQGDRVLRIPITHSSLSIHKSIQNLLEFASANPEKVFDVGPFIRCPYSILTAHKATSFFGKHLKNIIVPEEFKVWQK